MYIKQYPGITKIVNYYKDTKWLDKWKEKVGIEAAQATQNKSFALGNLLHDIIDDKFKGYSEDKIKFKHRNNNELPLAINLFDTIKCSDYFLNIKELVDNEYYFKCDQFGSFSGRFDFLYKNINDELVLCDLKTSKKPKKKEWITDYYTQVAAYAIGYYLKTKTIIDKVEILVVNEENFELQLFELSKTELKDFSIKFKEECINYNKEFFNYIDN